MRDIPDVKELLRWEGCPRLLIYLYFKKEAHITKMVDEISGSSGALYNAIPVLRKYGLLAEGVPKQAHRKGAKRKEYNLTKKGREVAKFLIDLQEKLSST